MKKSYPEYGYGKCPKCKKTYDSAISGKGTKCPKCNVEMKGIKHKR